LKLWHITLTAVLHNLNKQNNARLRGWQRITLNSNTTTVTTAAQWDWKRHALTVPLEAFVMCLLCLILDSASCQTLFTCDWVIQNIFNPL
ncbi:hypothetical protein FLL96_09515, partial [Vibrio cholerae]